MAEKALAEIEPANVAEPIEITLQYRGIETVSVFQRVDKFLRNFLTRLIKVKYLLFNETGGHTTKQRIQNYGYAEKNKYGHSYSFKYIFKHLSSVSATIAAACK